MVSQTVCPSSPGSTFAEPSEPTGLCWLSVTAISAMSELLLDLREDPGHELALVVRLRELRLLGTERHPVPRRHLIRAQLHPRHRIGEAGELDGVSFGQVVHPDPFDTELVGDPVVWTEGGFFVPAAGEQSG